MTASPQPLPLYNGHLGVVTGDGRVLKGAKKNAEGGAAGHAQYRSDIQCCELRHN